MSKEVGKKFSAGHQLFKDVSWKVQKVGKIVRASFGNQTKVRN
jgi:hypothetical protein